MARQVIWTQRAQDERIKILTFWIAHNKSITYSKNLNGLIKSSLILISKYPFLGKATQKQNVRVKILSNYLIIYEITATKIIILSIWDSRQKPRDINKVL